MRILREKLGKRYGHLLITFSSFLLLWSMERTNRLGKVLCDQKIWKVCMGQRWAEHGGAWLKVSYNIALLKWQEKGFLMESGFLQRAVYKSPHPCHPYWIFHFYEIRGGSPSSVTSTCWESIEDLEWKILTYGKRLFIDSFNCSLTYKGRASYNYFDIKYYEK